MLLTSDQIKIEALSLPAADRADLAGRLIDSLQEESENVIAHEWTAMARSRLAEIQSGSSLSRDGQDVMAKARSLVSR